MGKPKESQAAKHASSNNNNKWITRPCKQHSMHQTAEEEEGEETISIR